MFAGVALDVDLERYRSHRGPKIVEADVFDGQPVGKVTGISQSGREAHNTHFVIWRVKRYKLQ